MSSISGAEKRKKRARRERWQHFAAASVNRMDLMGRNVDYPGRALSFQYRREAESRSPYSDYYVKYHTALSGKLSQFALHLRRRTPTPTSIRTKAISDQHNSFYFFLFSIPMHSTWNNFLSHSLLCAACDLSSLFFLFGGFIDAAELKRDRVTLAKEN
jgi:hypothetical protein